MRAKGTCARRCCLCKPCPRHFRATKQMLVELQVCMHACMIRCRCNRAPLLLPRHHTHPAFDCKYGIAVGTASCFLAAAYSLSPVVAGAVVDKARACMYEKPTVGLQLGVGQVVFHSILTRAAAAKPTRAAASACAKLQVRQRLFCLQS